MSIFILFFGLLSQSDFVKKIAFRKLFPFLSSGEQGKIENLLRWARSRATLNHEPWVDFLSSLLHPKMRREQISETYQQSAK